MENPFDRNMPKVPQKSQTTAPAISGGSVRRAMLITADQVIGIGRHERSVPIFMHFLLQDLERNDPALHIKVVSILMDCNDRKRRQEPGYKYFPGRTKGRLKEVVPPDYWERARANMSHFMGYQVTHKKEPAQGGRRKVTFAAEMKRRKMQKAATAGSPSSPLRKKGPTQEEQQQEAAIAAEMQRLNLHKGGST